MRDSLRHKLSHHFCVTSPNWRREKVMRYTPSHNFCVSSLNRRRETVMRHALSHNLLCLNLVEEKGGIMRHTLSHHFLCLVLTEDERQETDTEPSQRLGTQMKLWQPNSYHLRSLIQVITGQHLHAAGGDDGFSVFHSCSCENQEENHWIMICT